MSSNYIPTISTSSLSDYRLVSEAARAGIFYFEIPQDCEKHLNEALEFCYRFPIDDEIKKYSDGKFGGYHQRDHDQIESFYIEKKDWHVLSNRLKELSEKMDILARNILEVVLQISGIPKEMWGQGTGNITKGHGQHHFSFNHYRPEKDKEGIKAHRDFGFVSILYVEKDGLEAKYQGRWEEVPLLKGHFVVILGKAFEMLVNDVSKVSAAWHRVRQLSDERASFAITCDNDENLPVLRYQEDSSRLETVYSCYNDYLKDCFEELYENE